jgi:hypothetical protein
MVSFVVLNFFFIILRAVWCREGVPSPRVVLLLDVWHPGLSQCEIDALNYCIGAQPVNDFTAKLPEKSDESESL